MIQIEIRFYHFLALALALGSHFPLSLSVPVYKMGILWRKVRGLDEIIHGKSLVPTGVGGDP